MILTTIIPEMEKALAQLDKDNFLSEVKSKFLNNYQYIKNKTKTDPGNLPYEVALAYRHDYLKAIKNMITTSMDVDTIDESHVYVFKWQDINELINKLKNFESSFLVIRFKRLYKTNAPKLSYGNMELVLDGWIGDSKAGDYLIEGNSQIFTSYKNFRKAVKFNNNKNIGNNIGYSQIVNSNPQVKNISNWMEDVGFHNFKDGFVYCYLGYDQKITNVIFSNEPELDPFVLLKTIFKPYYAYLNSNIETTELDKIIHDLIPYVYITDYYDAGTSCCPPGN